MNKPVRAKRFGGVAEVMEAVEKANASSLREAVKTLYSSELQAERTLALYREVVGRNRDRELAEFRGAPTNGGYCDSRA